MFVFNKLITGNFRIGVSQKMIVNALAKTSKNSPSVIAHRISGNWDPQTFPFSELMGAESVLLDHSRPYPFYLAYALEENCNPWETRLNGSQNGNGTVFAARSSDATNRFLSGAGVKNL